MRKVLFLTAMVAVLSTSVAVAQKRSASFSSSSYVTALGVKLYPGTAGGAVTIKHFLNKGIAVEGLATFWERGGRATGLLEFHWDIPNVAGLKWYAGPGFHVSSYNNNYYNNRRFGGSYVAAGLDGVIGADYKFNKIPLNISADWQPFFDFGSERYKGFGGDFGGISARYTF